jgi:hypothetical protein
MIASCTPERLNANLARLCVIVLYSGGKKGKSCLSGGGASKPHRSKYILVVDRFV